MDRPFLSTPAEARSSSGGASKRLLRRLIGPVTVAAAVGAAVFLALSVGAQKLTGTEAGDFADGRGYLPSLVHDPPETVRTTDDYGPPGPVSVVFADDAVEAGLTSTLSRPWIAVSSLTGDYRAIVAPHLPPASQDAVAVAPDGRALAWAYPDGIVHYDPVEDNARELRLDVGAPVRVGSFSPDGRLLTVYGGGALYIADTVAGVVEGEIPLAARPARQAVWTPNGEGLTFVEEGRLVTWGWRSGGVDQTPTAIDAGASLAWHPDGRRIAATASTRTGNRVQLFDVAADGSLEAAGTISREAYSLQRMLGFSSDTTVSGIGLGLETGPLPQLYRMSTESAVATDVTQLPADDRALSTMEFAAEPLQNGSAPFAEPDWPISALAKLVISLVTGLFVLGLLVTRRPRHG